MVVTLTEHQEQIIAAFIMKEKQERYRFQLASSDERKRNVCMGRLNHCRDLDLRYVVWLPRNTDVVALLRKVGSGRTVYIFSSAGAIDGTIMPLEDALEATVREGWGTILSCVPGRLAFYYDEDGERRALLQRPH